MGFKFYPWIEVGWSKQSPDVFMTKRFATVAHTRVKSLAAPGVTLALIFALLVLLERTYFGHAPGLYGACYGTPGRSIPAFWPRRNADTRDARSDGFGSVGPIDSPPGSFCGSGTLSGRARSKCRITPLTSALVQCRVNATLPFNPFYWMPVIAITNGADMTSLVEALANDIIHARFYYDLLLRITKEFAADPRIYSQSAAFWGLTSTALRDATLMRLARSYDQQRSSLSLVNWLETIRANLRLFGGDAFKERLSGNAFVDSLSEELRVPDATQLDRDIELVRGDDPLVKRLVLLRNNAAIHVSASSVVAGTDPFLKHALTAEELRELLARGKAILNRYSTLFNASTYSDQLVGADDYHFVIGAVRSRLNSDDEGVL